jgi:hypothetical protein
VEALRLVDCDKRQVLLPQPSQRFSVVAFLEPAEVSELDGYCVAFQAGRAVIDVRERIGRAPFN